MSITEILDEQLTEILEAYADNRQEYYESGKPTDPHYGATALNAIKKLLEDRAKEFAIWCNRNHRYIEADMWMVKFTKDPNRTTSELYALFLTNKNKTDGIHSND